MDEKTRQAVMWLVREHIRVLAKLEAQRCVSETLARDLAGHLGESFDLTEFQNSVVNAEKHFYEQATFKFEDMDPSIAAQLFQSPPDEEHPEGPEAKQ